MSAPTLKTPLQIGPYDALTVTAGLFSLLAVLALTAFLVNFGATLSDFSAFFAAGTLARADQAALAYDLDAFRAAYGVAFPGAPDGYGWFYPPTFLLIHEPLAALPFQAARLAWLAGTLALFAWAMRPWVQKPVHWIIVLAAPAIAFHLHAGQTGFLVAALVAFAMTGLMRNDRNGALMAGVAIGFLTLKPHLWALLPLFLIIERRWIVIASAAATTGFLVVLSLLAYGLEPWHAMVSSVISGYSQNHADQFHLFAKMGNIDGFLRFFGLEAARSIVLVTIMSAALATMIAMRRIGTPFALRLSFAVTASFLIAPHNMIYDHTLFVPLAAMLFLHPSAGRQNGLKGALLLLLVWPALYALVPGLDAYPLSVAIVALFATALLATAWRMRAI